MKAWLVILILLVLPLAAADYYNTTTLENANDLYGQALAVNTIVSGLLGYGMIIIAFAITFVILSMNYGAIAAIGGASFFSLIVSSILLPLGFIPFWVFRMMLVLAGVGVFLAIALRSQ